MTRLLEVGGAGALGITALAGAALAVLMLAQRVKRWWCAEPDVPVMTCGCPLDGRPAYCCMYCDRTSCAEHREQHSHAPESGPFADADIEATTLAEDFSLWESECSSPRVRRHVSKLRNIGGRR